MRFPILNDSEVSSITSLVGLIVGESPAQISDPLLLFVNTTQNSADTIETVHALTTLLLCADLLTCPDFFVFSLSIAN